MAWEITKTGRDWISIGPLPHLEAWKFGGVRSDACYQQKSLKRF